MINNENISNNSEVLIKPKIMIVTGNVEDLNIAVELVVSEGYQAIPATNGLEAINIFDREKPAVVIMDVLLKDMDGYEVSRIIKDLSKDKFVPVLFVPEFDTIEAKVKCHENGGVGLLTKPFNKTIFKSKIHTFTSLSILYSSNNYQRQELERHNKELKQNYEVASNVFKKVMHSEALNSSAIKYSLTPVAIFNGDILLAAYRPCGQLQVMLGDFTGHGISAAIGAIPVADIFYGMTAKGFGLADILEEINNKMLRILPRGLFLAACLFEYNAENNMLILWNAGLPGVLIYNENKSKVTEMFPSKNYPLGISSDIQTTNSIEIYCVKQGDRLLMFTDGVIEIRNKEKELYGEDRVIIDIENSKKKWLTDCLLEKLSEYSDNKKTDDTTLFEISFNMIDKPVEAQINNIYPQPLLNTSWKLEYILGAQTLKSFDPIPGIIQTIMEMQKLQKYKQDIFLIIRELFLNALDHGLLELDSRLKQDANGFSDYLREKQNRLTKLEHGRVIIKIEHLGHAEGGLLQIEIEDTGNGFICEEITRQLDSNELHYGRGILLVNAVCETLTFIQPGNHAKATYRWANTT